MSGPLPTLPITYRDDAKLTVEQAIDLYRRSTLGDLAVDAALQRGGIGRRLIDETRARLGPECMIVLLAAPKANDYYPKLGFEHHPRAWVLRGR